MRHQTLLTRLKNFSDQDWSQIFQGQPISMIDDEKIIIGTKQDSQVLLDPADHEFESVDELRRSILQDSQKYLDEYYRSNPISLSSFNKQLVALVKKHTPQHFAGTTESPAEFSLYVESDQLLAENATSPRHAYGLYYQITAADNEKNLPQKISQWIHSGEAYNEYLSMNVCRYNC